MRSKPRQNTLPPDTTILEAILRGEYNTPLIDNDDVIDMLRELDRIIRIGDQSRQIIELVKVFDLPDITIGVLMQHLLCNTARLYSRAALKQFDDLLVNFVPHVEQ